MKQLFKITGMSCASCAAHVEKAAGTVPGVLSASVNLMADSMLVEYDPAVTGPEKIVDAVAKAGYGASSDVASDTGDVLPGSERASAAVGKRLLWSLVFLAPLSVLAMGFHGWFWLQMVLLVPILWLNRGYFVNGGRRLLSLAPNMDSLVALGAGAGVIYSLFLYGGEMFYFDSAGMVLTLVTVGKYLEARSKKHTGDAIGKLLSLAPAMATVERDGVEATVPAAELKVGDVVVLRPGGAAPVDGVIVDGFAVFDESVLTGESIPVEKFTGSKVLSGALNTDGFVKVRAEKVGGDTTLSRIAELVREAGSTKAPIAKLADRVSAVFVPAVIAVAVCTFAGWMLAGRPVGFSLTAAVTVLVISCPCALGLATPVAIMVGAGRGAESGILFKSAEALQTVHAATCAVLDKTGTVTIGRPEVTDVVPQPGVSETELLRMAAAVEKSSEHPLAKAVVAQAAAEGLELPGASEFYSLGGLGVIATVEGHEYAAGRDKLFEDLKLDASPLVTSAGNLAHHGKTPLLFMRDGAPFGVIAVADRVRADSPEAVAALGKLGLRVVMLTGDNPATAGAIAKDAVIHEVIAGVLPEQKAEEIEKLRKSGEKVVMVGDGVNDAPALAAADTGMAIGAGSDIAIDAADVVLVGNSLFGAVAAIRLSRAVFRNVKENLFWAFFYNVLLIPLAAAGLLNPVFGAAAMSASSVCVVANALRLRRFNDSRL
ncbi:MAG: heavy metal translocating P-type ATPase [Victivallaceae bacterium]|nr:heavy metal translocating P-type ATPase [Victivallaceae bacterium]